MPRKVGPTAACMLGDSAQTTSRCAVDAGEVATAWCDGIVAGVGAVVLEQCVSATYA